DRDVHRVLAVVVRITVRVVPLRHENVSDMSRLVVARDLRFGTIGWPWWTRTAAVAARTVGGFHRSHNAIGERAIRLDECLNGVGYDSTWSEDVALNRIEDFRAWNLTLHILRNVAIRQSGVSRAPALQIQDSELTALKCRVSAKQLDDRLRVGPFLKFLENH